MKKMMAMMLAVVLCVLCLPVTAEENATQVYTHPTQGYSITVPASWLCVDNTNLQDYITAYENGEMTFTGTNAQTLQALQAQIAGTDCAVLINEYANNIVIVRENAGIALTKEMFISMLIPALKQQLTAQVPSIQFNAEGEVLTLGENEFIVLAGAYQMNGITASVDMLFYLDGTDLYTINLTTTSLFGPDITNTFYAAVQEACATFTVAK